MGDDKGVSIPPAILLAIIGSFAAGGGVGSLAVPGINQTAIASCLENGKTAISVAAQHGDELQAIRTDIQALKLELIDRTRFRWTAEQQRQYALEHDRVHSTQARTDETQDKRINFLEGHGEREH